MAEIINDDITCVQKVLPQNALTAETPDADPASVTATPIRGAPASTAKKDLPVSDYIKDILQKKGNGKGRGWMEEELLALAQAAASVCMNAAVGAQMSKAVMGRKIRAAFITSDISPSRACTKKYGTELDARRWDWRSSEVCLKMWLRVR